MRAGSLETAPVLDRLPDAEAIGSGNVVRGTATGVSDDLADRMRSGARWVVATRVLGITVTLALNVVLARTLAPADFGRFTMLMSLIALVGFFCTLGLSNAVVRFVAESVAQGDRSRARQVLGQGYRLVLIATLVVSLTVMAAWHWLASWLSLPESGMAPLIGLNIGLLALIQLTSESLRGLHELRVASVMSGGQTGGLLSNLLLLVLLAAALPIAHVTLDLAVTLNVLAMLLVLPLGLYALRLHVRNGLSGAAKSLPLPIATLLATSLPLMVIQVVSFASSQADLWIAGVACAEDLALYSAARRLMLVVAIPLQMVNFLVMASVAELNAQSRIDELEALLRRAATIAAVPSLGALLISLVMGGPILEALFGPYYRDAATLLALLSLGQFALAWSGSSQCALTMTGRQNVALAVALTSALVLLVAGTVMARTFGTIGLAATSAAVVAAESLTQWLLAHKLVGVRANMSLDLPTLAALISQVGDALPTALRPGTPRAKGGGDGPQ